MKDKTLIVLKGSSRFMLIAHMAQFYQSLSRLSTPAVECRQITTTGPATALEALLLSIFNTLATTKVWTRCFALTLGNVAGCKSI